ncbi:MAG: hypothetical protein EXR50_06925 [Dehalococcoidia bacterium]|nr:hypothetical protein [Dehalococcoidia bacterium]
MPRPRVHAIATMAGVWLLTSKRPSRRTVVSALVFGVLVDLDHVVDWAWAKRDPATKHYVVPLHGWEFLPLLYYFASRTAFFSYLAHLTFDQVFNNVRTWASYSLLYRAFHRFDRDSFTSSYKRAKWLQQPWYDWW